jgi:hypothetical protein
MMDRPFLRWAVIGFAAPCNAGRREVCAKLYTTVFCRRDHRDE